MGKLELAKNAWGVFLDTVTNEDSENRDRVMEAFGGGARLAMLMGGVEMGGSAAVTNAVTNYQVGKIYGQDPQALIQEAQELNPNSALAKKFQESLDNGKKISGGDLKRLVLENEKAIANMDSSSVESDAEQQPNDAGSPRRNGWRNAAELARQEDLSVMDALNRAGLSGSVDLARANPQSYAQSFQEALKGGASYDQALMRATSDAAMKVVGRQAPMDTLLYNIGGDPKKAISVMGDALNRAGIRMTPGELNLLGIVAAEASAYQRDAAFQTKVALEKLKGLPNEKAWTAASETLWQEATDRVIEHGIADFAFSLDKGTNLRTGEIYSDLDQEAASQQSAWKQVTEDVSAAMESENEVEDADIESPKTIDNAEESDTMDSRGMAMSLRSPKSHILTEEEIQSVLTEARALGIDEKLLRINQGAFTGFWDAKVCINIRGDVLPDPDGKSARDLMSIRAVLAHEYYGHYLHHPSEYPMGDWRDEFRASYEAAVKAPNLTEQDRAYLMVDAYDRAREAGHPLEYDETARRIIFYGY